MSPGNPTRLLTGKPADPAPQRKFKAIRLNAARFDQSWDRKRGSAVRLMTVVLRDDHEALQRRVCATEQTAKTYADAAAWLQRESAHLRKIARLLETAGGRLAAVVSRCGDSVAAPSN